MNTRVILMGGGGHGLVVAALAAACNLRIEALIDPERPANARFPGAEWLGAEDDAVLAFDANAVLLLNGVGANKPATARRRVFERLSARGYRFPTLVHPTAWVAPGVELSEGVQVMAGAVVQPGARIGANVILNTRASVDHECEIGAHVHVAPGATLCGCVSVGEGAMVGAGAVVIPGVKIGAGAMIGAGAAVTRDVPAGATVAGAPAKPV